VSEVKGALIETHRLWREDIFVEELRDDSLDDGR